MTAQILPIDSEEHRRAQELLPWLINGTLDSNETMEVREHLTQCNVCQEDGAALAQLRQLPIETPPTAPLDLAWTALRNRLDASNIAPSPAARAGAWWRDRWRLAAVFQAALIAVLAVMLVRQWPPAEPYRALDAASASDANAIANFRRDATQAQMSAALRAAQARVVDGPTVTDAYLLRLPDALPERQPGHAGERAQPHRQSACDGAPVRFAFRAVDGVGTRGKPTFAARWLAYARLCQRFAAHLTVRRA